MGLDRRHLGFSRPLFLLLDILKLAEQAGPADDLVILGQTQLDFTQGFPEDGLVLGFKNPAAEMRVAEEMGQAGE